MAKNILVLDSRKWQKPKRHSSYVLPDNFLDLVQKTQEMARTGSTQEMVIYVKPFAPYFLRTKHDLNAIHTALEEIWTMSDRPYTIYMILHEPEDANSSLLDSADDIL